MTRSRHLIAALTFLLFAPILLRAQNPPSFLIESIDVRGARFASESVVARESLLIPGRTYTEPQLRHAMSRINRLPFVLDSTFAVEKGTERGAYVLVVTIVETKPLFVEAQSMFGTSSGNEVSNEEFLRSGARWFLGSSTLVHGSTDFDDHYEAGLTQYNLFGRPGYVTLNVRWTSDGGAQTVTNPLGERERYTADIDPSPEILVGFPVFGNHSIQGRWSYASFGLKIESEGAVVEESTQANQSLALAWVWDTTDDPILPTRGSLWRTEGSLQLVGRDVKATTGSDIDGDAEIRVISTSLHHYHPLNDWMSVMVGGGVGASRSEFDALQTTPPTADSVTTWSIYPEAGLTVSLWPERLTRRFGDLRWETRASYNKAGGDFTDIESAVGSTQIVQRSVWGTLRLGFSYFYYDLERP